MKLSLKGRLFVLVGFAISLAALPIIFFSREYLLDSAMKRERESFANTVMLVEDSISLRYLHMLTAEVESVRIAKEDLGVTLALIHDAVLHKSASQEAMSWEQWQNLLHKWDYHFAIFDQSGLPVLSDPLVTAATDASLTDFKGQSMRTLLVGKKSVTDATFAVVNVRHNSEKEFPVLLCFKSVKNQGMLILAVKVEHIILSRLQTEKGLRQNLQERLSELELHPGASIAVLAGNGEIVAQEGLPITLENVPPAARDRARNEKKFSGEARGPKGNDFFFNISYFKAFDWYIVTAISKEAIFAPAEQLTRYLVSFAVIVIVLSLLTMLLLTARTIRPLAVLTDKARALAQDEFSADGETHLEEKIREDMPVHRYDEIGQLATSFAFLGKALDENIRRLKETVAVRQRMEGELNAARDIQMGILPPPDSAPRTDSYTAVAFLEPAKEVGGDLYDFFTAPDGRQVVVIGDVSDKGVPAALFMSMTVTLVRYAMAEGLSCAEAMRSINERLAENNPSCMFVTLFIGVFDPESGEFEYASGAHCPPFVVNPAPAVPVRALTDVSGPLVGAMEGMDFEICRASIAAGEYCVIYTDGVSEAMNEDKELFSEERLAEVLDGLREAEPEQVINGIMEALKAHRGKAAQSDDITILCFKRKK